MTYRVIRIEEDLDFGCEERSDGSPVLAVVTLQGEDGRKRCIRQPDQLLYDRGIQEGDEVVLLTEEGREVLAGV